MKLITTKAEAGRYIVSAVTLKGDIRYWEVCKEYNEDTIAFGDGWRIYDTNLTTNEKREWYGWGWSSKARAVGFIKLVLKLENLAAQG
jgi:hypothetical protein